METLPPLLISEFAVLAHFLHNHSSSGCLTCHALPLFANMHIVWMFVVAGAVAAMGGLQSLSQWATVGKPKAVGVDPWDRQVHLSSRFLHNPLKTVGECPHADRLLRLTRSRAAPIKTLKVTCALCSPVRWNGGIGN